MKYGWPWHNTYIDTVITDNSLRSVGLRVSGKIPGSPPSMDTGLDNRGLVWLVGGSSNTFTGMTYVSDCNGIMLAKTGGTQAIRGDIYVSNGGGIRLEYSSQISDSSTVTLDGRGNKASFVFNNNVNYGLQECFHKLVVLGTGVLSYWAPPSSRKLFLDDLFIESHGLLEIHFYVPNWTFFLVRKDSVHLDDALHRVKFLNRSEPKGSLREYDKDYWEVIPGFPEPGTYGAILSAVALGLVWLRMTRCRANVSFRSQWPGQNRLCGGSGRLCAR